MERTESKVVQVAPSFENQMIQQMQAFGWNLAGRQEMVEEGDTVGVIDSSGVSTSTKIHKYVKLHFQRSLELPNLQKLQALESEHDAIGFGQTNTSLKWPVIVLVFGIIGFLANISKNPIGAIVFGGLLAGGGGYWAYSRVQWGKQVVEANDEAARKRHDLQRSAAALLG